MGKSELILYFLKSPIACVGQKDPDEEIEHSDEMIWGCLGFAFVFMPGKTNNF